VADLVDAADWFSRCLGFSAQTIGDEMVHLSKDTAHIRLVRKAPDMDMSAAFTSGSSPAIIQNPASMYQANSAEQRKYQVSLLGDGQDPSIKFDMNESSGESVMEKRKLASAGSPRPRHGVSGATASELPRSHVGTDDDSSMPHGSKGKRPVSAQSPKSASAQPTPGGHVEESLGKTVETIRGYDTVVDERDLYVFIVRNGKAAIRSSEFIAFRRKYQYCWGAIAALIDKVENVFAAFSVPLAYVDGQKLALLANDELSKPTVDKLVECVRNRDQVQALISLPGRRFAVDTEEGRACAATVIESGVRAFLTRKHYLEGRRRNAAATCIQRRFHVHSLRRSAIE
jgi:hypothetical protein